MYYFLIAMEYRNIANKSVLLPYRAIPNLQSNFHITSFAFDVVGIERFGIAPFEDTAFAALVATMQAAPGIEHIGLALFAGGVIYFGSLHTILSSHAIL